MKKMKYLGALILAMFFTLSCAGRPLGAGGASRPKISEAREEKALMSETMRTTSPSTAVKTKDSRMQMEDMAFAPAPEPEEGDGDFNTSDYDKITENQFKDAKQNPLSTFSIDVDTASYSNLRNYLENGSLPPKDAVRIEELLNYFDYDYPEPKGEHPFSISTELADCPWNKDSKLFMVGIQGKRLDYQNLKPSNLVFLLDTSGSMSADNKLPLVKDSLALLLKGLGPEDRIAMVAYAGSAGLVLESTKASDAKKILAAMDKLSAGGSTAGGAGIALAYKVAKDNYISGGNNRVILCTDGDFNVGTSGTGDLVRMMEERRKDDIYLTICGFGMGNYKDGRMEQISKAGNGNYFYIDSQKEAQKVFVKEMRANMFTIAKDVKIQIEFNPALVASYRLIGYENRVMAAEDFKDDTKDAGELGPGHRVTALYEILPPGAGGQAATADELKYQNSALSAQAASGEMLTVKFRYKPINSDTSIPIEQAVFYKPRSIGQASRNLRFAAAVTEFGMLLRGSSFAGSSSYPSLIDLAKASLGPDESGYRAEFIKLAQKASSLTNP